jgi:hypothetical protein
MKEKEIIDGTDIVELTTPSLASVKVTTIDDKQYYMSSFCLNIMANEFKYEVIEVGGQKHLLPILPAVDGGTI